MGSLHTVNVCVLVSKQKFGVPAWASVMSAILCNVQFFCFAEMSVRTPMRGTTVKGITKLPFTKLLFAVIFPFGNSKFLQISAGG